MTRGVGARALAFGFAAMGYAMAGDMAFAGSQCGKAAWYDLEGLTASGEQSSGAALAAAHRSLPFGTRVKVENLRNGRTVVVRVNDRGPFVAGRVIDVTKAAAEKLGFISAGIARVRVTALDGKGAGIVGSCTETPAVAAKPAKDESTGKKAVAAKTVREAPADPVPAKKIVVPAPAEKTVVPAAEKTALAPAPKDAPAEAVKADAPVAANPAEPALPKEAEIIAAARKAAIVIPPKSAVAVAPKRVAVVSVPYEETPVEDDEPVSEPVGDIDTGEAGDAEDESATGDEPVVEASLTDELPAATAADIPVPRLRPGGPEESSDTRFSSAFQPDLTRFIYAFQPDDYNSSRPVKDLPFTLLGLD